MFVPLCRSLQSCGCGIPWMTDLLAGLARQPASYPATPLPPLLFTSYTVAISNFCSFIVLGHCPSQSAREAAKQPAGQAEASQAARQPGEQAGRQAGSQPASQPASQQASQPNSQLGKTLAFSNVNSKKCKSEIVYRCNNVKV